jgi:hypothetical protein
MDVVKKTIESLRGSIDLATQQGAGSAFTLLDHVHADAAARQGRNLPGGGEARREQELVDLVVAPTGRILLKAEHAGAQVLITVRDDGAGLDTARIRLPGGGEARREQELVDLVVAQRGAGGQEAVLLGLDVVKKTIESLRGSIDLATQQGAGSAFTLRLPLTLAISRTARAGAGTAPARRGC